VLVFDEVSFFFLLAIFVTNFKQISHFLGQFPSQEGRFGTKVWLSLVSLVFVFGLIGPVSVYLLLERSQRGEKVSYSHRHSIPSLKKYPCGKILRKSLALPREYQNSQQTSKGVTKVVDTKHSIP
jgi:hypothetical protein